FFKALNSPSWSFFSVGHHISIPSYPSFLTLAQYSSIVPLKPQLVARTFNLKLLSMVDAGLDEANNSGESSNAAVAVPEACMKFLRFNLFICFAIETSALIGLLPRYDATLER